MATLGWRRLPIFGFLAAMLPLVGCTPKWENTKSPDLTGTNALASVSSFVASNGWNSFSATNKSIFWVEDEPAHYIAELPWKLFHGQKFPALTSGGILYVLLGDEFHHDYYGVAYNPKTNHFPEWIRGFKPIGDHWYVWAQPEFWSSAKTDGRYE